MGVPGGDIQTIYEENPTSGEYSDEIEFSAPGKGGYVILTVQAVGLTGTVTLEGCLINDQWEQLGGLTVLSVGGNDGDSITESGIYQGQFTGVSKIRLQYSGSACSHLKAVAVA